MAAAAGGTDALEGAEHCPVHEGSLMQGCLDPDVLDKAEDSAVPGAGPWRLGPGVGEDADVDGAQGTCGGDENVLGLAEGGAARTCPGASEPELNRSRSQ